MIQSMRPDPDLNQFLNEIRKVKILSKQEELTLVKLAQAGSADAAKRLCAQNIPFVVKVAKRYRNVGLPFQDLINEGAIGMMSAVYKFDPASGHRFLTYAVWWVRQAICRAISDKARTVRVSCSHDAPIRRVKRLPLRQVIGGAYFEDAQAEADRTGTRADFLELGLNASRGPVSMDHRPAPDELSPSEAIASQAPQPDKLTEAREAGDIINRMRGKLPPNYRLVITLSFGLDNHNPHTLREIGDRMGISHERVRQIKEEALKRMKAMSKPYRG